METIIFLAVIVAVILVASALSAHSSKKTARKILKNNIYSYMVKSSVMTNVEGEFFVKLDQAVKERYYVFPQVHLSSLFDHKVVGQEWKYAFGHINGKSVDYVLCDRTTLQPMYAIELDDYTHDRADRQMRDIEVARIFEEANLPLVRFKNKDVSENEIIQTLMNTHKL